MPLLSSKSGFSAPQTDEPPTMGSQEQEPARKLLLKQNSTDDSNNKCTENRKDKTVNMNTSKRKTKKNINRGKGKKKESILSMMSTNAAQLKGKIDCFKSELKN